MIEVVALIVARVGPARKMGAAPVTLYVPVALDDELAGNVRFSVPEVLRNTLPLAELAAMVVPLPLVPVLIEMPWPDEPTPVMPVNVSEPVANPLDEPFCVMEPLVDMSVIPIGELTVKLPPSTMLLVVEM